MSPDALSIEPFGPEDLLGFELTEPVLAGAEQLGADLVRLSSQGSFWTVRKAGEPVCIGGVARLWPGVGEAWLGATRLARQYPLFMVRGMRHHLGVCAAEMRLHRVQCVVLAARRSRRRWAGLLGFEEEGLMRKFGPQGEDFYRFAKVY